MMMKTQNHIVCIPFPAQGHINPMMQFAKLLHSRGFYITFVNTDFVHNRVFGSDQGVKNKDYSERFCFESISDGLPASVKELTDDVEEFCRCVKDKCEEPLRELLTKKLQQAAEQSSDGDWPPVTCMVSDVFMSFSLKLARELAIPDFAFCPAAAASFMAFLHYPEIIKRGLVPLKDESCLTNGYLDTTVDWIPGMGKTTLKELGSFLWTTDPNEFFLNWLPEEMLNSLKASAVIFNTYYDLEHDVVDAIRTIVRHVYTIGPLVLQCQLNVTNNQVKSIKSSMWIEETNSLKWLDNFKAGSVIYVNFGSTTVITAQQLQEFAWGIASTKHPFLWVIRPDLVLNGQASLSQEFMVEIEGRGILVKWCPQLEVLSHPSVAVFLTHCGWNSTLESISLGVPMLCWPFFAEQQIDCRYACKEWGVGMEVNHNASREEIGALIMEFMREGEKGKDMRNMAMKWKKSAQVAVGEEGSSHGNLDLLIHDLTELREI